MMNIPTELLRTMVAVVELRSFTRAAQTLGITQPAVSAQIKRLQSLLGGELFDKSAPGVTLTEKGKVVVEYARKLLAVNDQILGLTAARPSGNQLRIGMLHDYFEPAVFDALTGFRSKYPEFRFHLRCDHSDFLLRELRQGDLDLTLALTDAPPAMAPYRHWFEDMVWVGATAEALDAGDPLQLAVLGYDSLSARVGIAALEQAGRVSEVIYVGRSLTGVFAAVRAGLGITSINRRVVPSGLASCVFSPKLPRLPQLFTGVYLRENGNRRIVEELGDAIAAAIDPDKRGVRPEMTSPSMTPVDVSDARANSLGRGRP
jgi:DNA-binding transcriptional LysR family regulator